MTTGLPITGQQRVVRCSNKGFTVVEDFKQAVARLTTATPAELADAYAAYVARQIDLYDYVARLERPQRVPQFTHTLKF